MPTSDTPTLRDVARRIADAAPSLAGALGGPLAGAAADVLRRVVLGGEEVSDERLAAAIITGGPETLLRLREAEHAFRTALAEAALESERVAASDRDSARRREVAVRDRTPACLGAGVILGFFGVLAAMLWREMPEQAEPAFSIMLGALGTMTAAVINYYFGSSAGSKQKTSLLRP